MTYTIAIVLVVLLVMTLTIFFLLKREVKDINNRSKVYFTQKAQEYTDSINRSEEVIEESPVQEKKDIIENNENENTVTSIVYLEKKANYEIDDLLKIMKDIDSKFNLDNVKLIKSFIKDYVKPNKEQLERYHDLKMMKDYVEKIGILNILTSEDEDLTDQIIKKLTLINEDIFNEYYSVSESFQVEEFCNYLDYEMGKCDPTIYVYVGEKDVDYNKLDKNIKTIYSKDIYKGLKILYLNQLYDFSLS